MEQAKREAALVLAKYERELFMSRRFVEAVHIGIVRFILTAPVDFLQRVDALREALPEIDRLKARKELQARIEEWRRQVAAEEQALDQSDLNVMILDAVERSVGEAQSAGEPSDNPEHRAVAETERSEQTSDAPATETEHRETGGGDEQNNAEGSTHEQER